MINRRSLLTAFGLAPIASQQLAPAKASPQPFDDGPLRADDVTGTTDFADWLHKQKKPS